MFFENLADIPKIAEKVPCSIFVLKDLERPSLKNVIFLEPDDDKKTPVISVESMRDFLSFTSSKETTDRYFVISPADAMTREAANAFLKTLEEPNDFCHFVLITKNLGALLPTIRSRSAIFVQKVENSLDEAPKYPKKTMDLAKKLISASSHELPSLATDLANKKDREIVLGIVSASVEILYKSYFKTKNPKFLTKIPNFINLYDALNQNGHVKLQIVANLI